MILLWWWVFVKCWWWFEKLWCRLMSLLVGCWIWWSWISLCGGWWLRKNIAGRLSFLSANIVFVNALRWWRCCWRIMLMCLRFIIWWCKMWWSVNKMLILIFVVILIIRSMIWRRCIRRFDCFGWCFDDYYVCDWVLCFKYDVYFYVFLCYLCEIEFSDCDCERGCSRVFYRISRFVGLCLLLRFLLFMCVYCFFLVVFVFWVVCVEWLWLLMFNLMVLCVKRLLGWRWMLVVLCILLLFKNLCVCLCLCFLLLLMRVWCMLGMLGILCVGIWVWRCILRWRLWVRCLRVSVRCFDIVWFTTRLARRWIIWFMFYSLRWRCWVRWIECVCVKMCVWWGISWLYVIRSRRRGGIEARASIFFARFFGVWFCVVILLCVSFCYGECDEVCDVDVCDVCCVFVGVCVWDVCCVSVCELNWCYCVGVFCDVCVGGVVWDWVWVGVVDVWVGLRCFLR